MVLAHDVDRIWITTGPGVSAESPGNVSTVIRDPLSGDDEEGTPVQRWLDLLPGATTA